MSKYLLSTVLASSVFATGCATLTGGGASNLNVNVEEPRQDLEVRIEGLSNNETIIRRVPEFSVQLNRGSDYRVTVRSPQYETKEVTVSRSIRPAFWANLLLLPLFPVGMGIDALNNNMWEHNKQTVNVRLERERQGANGDWVLPIVVSRGLQSQVYEAPILR